VTDPTALLLAAGVHPASHLPLGTPGDRCAGCRGCRVAGEGRVCGVSGRVVRCSDALPILRAGLAAMAERETEMRALEPSNGWGSYEGAVAYLVNIADACEASPRGTLAVSW